MVRNIFLISQCLNRLFVFIIILNFLFYIAKNYLKVVGAIKSVEYICEYEDMAKINKGIQLPVFQEKFIVEFVTLFFCVTNNHTYLESDILKQG